MLDWEVAVWTGRGWSGHVGVKTIDGIAAARTVHRATGYRRIKVRPNYSNLAWQVYKFAK